MSEVILDLDYEELKALAELTENVASEVNIKRLLEKILNKSGDFIESSLGSVILHDLYDDSLFFASAIGDNSFEILEQWGEEANNRIPIEGSIAGKVFKTKEPVIVNELEEYFKGVDALTKNKTSSIICVPLTVSGECIGVMQFINKESDVFDKKDAFLLSYFANICAIAIRNAQYISELVAHTGISPILKGDISIKEIIKSIFQPARKEELTIMFVDMRGFSKLSFLIGDPKELHLKLSEYLSLVSGEVYEYKGSVNKILGDGVLAIFDGKECAINALRCSFSTIEKFSKLVRIWDKSVNEDLSFLDIGFGITTDNKVIRGTLKGRTFRDYSVTGVSVNVAAAFEKDARNGNRVIIDQKTYHKAETILRGVDGPFIYEYKKSEESSIKYTRYYVKSVHMGWATKVFLCHQTDDRNYIEPNIIDSLKKYNINVWYSPYETKDDCGMDKENWSRLIIKGLDVCEWAVVVVSKDSVKSHWVKREVEAIIEDRRFNNKLIPVVIDESTPRELNPLLVNHTPIIARDVADIGRSIYYTIFNRRKVRC